MFCVGVLRNNQQSNKRVPLMIPDRLGTGMSETCPCKAGPGMVGKSQQGTSVIAHRFVKLSAIGQERRGLCPD